jgi:hypothetical protein
MPLWELRNFGDREIWCEERNRPPRPLSSKIAGFSRAVLEHELGRPLAPRQGQRSRSESVLAISQ